MNLSRLRLICFVCFGAAAVLLLGLVCFAPRWRVPLPSRTWHEDRSWQEQGEDDAIRTFKTGDGYTANLFSDNEQPATDEVAVAGLARFAELHHASMHVTPQFAYATTTVHDPDLGQQRVVAGFLPQTGNDWIQMEGPPNGDWQERLHDLADILKLPLTMSSATELPTSGYCDSAYLSSIHRSVALDPVWYSFATLFGGPPTHQDTFMIRQEKGYVVLDGFESQADAVQAMKRRHAVVTVRSAHQATFTENYSEGGFIFSGTHNSVVVRVSADGAALEHQAHALAEQIVAKLDQG